MSYIQVNIGRNIDGEPMSDTAWDQFAGAVAFAIYGEANRYEAFDMLTDIELHNGHGTWDGVQEESRHISSFWEDGFDIDALKIRLRDLKESYFQDNIALIVGSELI